MKKIIATLCLLVSFSTFANETETSNKTCSLEIENLIEASALYEQAPSINTSIDLEAAKRSLKECIQAVENICF